MGMAKEPTRPNVVAIVVGVIIGAVCGAFIGFFTQWWGWGLAAGIGFLVVWLIAQRVWWRRRPRTEEIEDPYDGR